MLNRNNQPQLQQRSGQRSRSVSPASSVDSVTRRRRPSSKSKFYPNFFY